MTASSPPYPIAAAPVPGRGGRARSVALASPGAFSSDPRALPAGQIIILLSLHVGSPDGDADLVRALVPRRRATPTSDDYRAVLDAGLADMQGGLHLTEAGTAAAAAILRALTHP